MSRYGGRYWYRIVSASIISFKCESDSNTLLSFLIRCEEILIINTPHFSLIPNIGFTHLKEQKEFLPVLFMVTNSEVSFFKLHVTYLTLPSV